MTIEIAIRFPWGRYHATPWGRHANEGTVEWPPSPWRLLRAFYATWKVRVPDEPASTIEPLLSKLASPPCYFAPEVRPSHSRHYMPEVGHGSIGKPDTTLVIDSFVVLSPDEELHVQWDVELNDDERRALGLLLEALPYLGRAESTCEARLVEPGEDNSVTDKLIEWKQGTGSSQATELLAPLEPLDFAALTMTTDEVRSARRIDPPGTQRLSYCPPQEDPRPPRRARKDPKRLTGVHAVRWALDGNALPPLHSALVVAHVLRMATLNKYGKHFDRITGSAGPSDPVVPKLSPILTGRRSTNEPLALDHVHAHYLVYQSELTSNTQYCDTAVIWARSEGGFNATELQSLTDLRRLWFPDHLKNMPKLNLGIEGAGAIHQVAPELLGGEEAGEGKVWRTQIPFVPPRHQKKLPWGEFVETEVRRELKTRPWLAESSVAAVRILDQDARRFRTHRPDGSRLSQATRGAMVEVEFAEPVKGPIILGKHAHLTLGLFRPI